MLHQFILKTISPLVLISCFVDSSAFAWEDTGPDSALGQLRQALKGLPESKSIPRTSNQAFTLDELAQLLKSQGYVSIKKINERTLGFKMEGLNVLLIRYKDGDLQLCMVVSGEKYTLEQANEWNRNKRITKSFITKSGSIVLECDLNAVEGIDENTIEKFLATFSYSLGAFRSHLRSSQTAQRHSSEKKQAELVRGVDCDPVRLAWVAKLV